MFPIHHHLPTTQRPRLSGKGFNASLRAIIATEAAYAFGPEGDWLSGRCMLLALALRQALQVGQLMMVGRRLPGGHIVDHMVLAVAIDDEQWLIDGDGLQTTDQMRAKLTREFGIRPVGTGYVNWLAIHEAGLKAAEEDVDSLANMLVAAGLRLDLPQGSDPFSCSEM